MALTRARGPGRGLPVATGSLANAIGRAKTAPGPALTLSMALTRARGPGRGLPVATGSLANAIGAPKQPRGSGVLLSGISGWFSLSLGAWRVGAEQSGAAKFWFIGFGGAKLLEAIGPAGRCSGGVVSIYWFQRPRLNLLCHPYARARARPWSRCYGVARQPDRSRQNR